MRKILALPLGMNGCTWIRVMSPFDKMKQLGVASPLYVFPENHIAFNDNYEQSINLAEVIVWRNGHQDLLEEILLKFDCREKKFIFDADDNDFESPHWQDHYRYSGTQDVWYMDRAKQVSIPMWLDEESALGKACPKHICYPARKNLECQNKLKQIISFSHAVCVTQPRLGRVYEPFNKNVWVIPNAIDFKTYRRLDFKKDYKKTRIGWAGGASHYEDFFLIKKWLKEFLNSHKDVTLVLVGAPPLEVFKEFDQKQLEIYGWVYPEAYPYMLQTLNIDIAVIPLVGNTFDVCKSSHKYSEFSAIGAASLVSKVSPYKEVITDGVNGELFSNGKEFRKKLNKLYEDRIYRATIAHNAYNNIYTNFNADSWARTYARRIESLFGEKDNGPTNSKE